MTAQDHASLARARRRRTTALGAAALGLLGCGAGDGADSGGRDGAALELREVTAERGLSLSLARAADGRYFMPDSMAGGCALVDVDGDGDLDVFVAHGRWDHAAGAPAADGLGRLLVQEPGGAFRDVSEAAGVVGPRYGMGVATGDVDDDGDVDLYVSCFGPDALLLNRGDGTFEDASARVASERTAAWGASATFIDLEPDGDLDLFVTNYVDYAPGTDGRYPEGPGAGGTPEFAAPANFPGTLDALLLNRGDGTFGDVAAARGIDAPGRGLGVAAGDWDGDGRVDLYVANDGQANHCWVQRADGTFGERALALGLALTGDGRPEAGMGVARGDVDGDGGEDLLLTHLAQETHTLYLARGRGDARTFGDRTLRAGLAAPTVDMTGFGVALADLDLDGALDLIAVHGRVLRGSVIEGADEAPRWRPYAERDLVALGAWSADPGDARFTPHDAGEFSRRVETGRGLALGDVDGDGDLDALVTTAAGAVRLFECAGPPRGHFLAVRATLPARGGRDALGAELRVVAGGREQRRTLQTAHGYLSASEPVARFGLGDVQAYDSLEVRWPDGTIDRLEGGEADREVVLTPSTGR